MNILVYPVILLIVLSIPLILWDIRRQYFFFLSLISISGVFIFYLETKDLQLLIYLAFISIFITRIYFSYGKLFYLDTFINKIILLILATNLIYLFLLQYYNFGDKDAVGKYALLTESSIIFYFITYALLKKRIIDDRYVIDIILLLLSLVFIGEIFLDILSIQYVPKERFGQSILGVNPTGYGSLYSSILVFFVIAKYDKKSLKDNILVFILLLAIFASETRAGLLAIIISFFIYLYIKGKIAGAVFILGIGVTSVILISLYYPFGIFERINLLIFAYQTENIDLFTNSRYQLWLGAINYFNEFDLKNVFFGGGIADYRNLSYLYVDQGFSGYAHNHYLKLLTDKGILGLSLLLLFYFSMLRKSFRAFKFFTGANRKLFLGIFILIINYMILDIFGARFDGLSLFYIWPLIAVFIIKLERVEKEELYASK